MEALELWVALAEILGAKSPVFLPLLEAFQTPEAIFATKKEDLVAAVPGLGAGMLSRLSKGAGGTDAKKILDWCRKNGVRVLAYCDPEYPAALRTLAQPPVVLYCRGNYPNGEKDFAVGVVGTRSADAYGAAVTYKLSFELAAAGAVIVSGMADGIDGIAAAAALDACGRTVAVLGCGIDIAYPKHHARLMREIEQSGAVLTEYAPGTRPNGWNFPIRNRLISALSGALVVTEAGEHSGALITAKYALLHGKPLFAIPGDITKERSFGTNRLIDDGARVALCAEDVLAAFRFLYSDVIRDRDLVAAKACSAFAPERLRAHGMRMPEEPEIERVHIKKRVHAALFPESEAAGQVSEAASAREVDLSSLDEKQQKLYHSLPETPFSLDLLAQNGLSAGEAASVMTIFELYGLVCAIPGGLYKKN